MDGERSTRIRPVIATLAGAGLRVGEAVALDWRDVSLATGTLTVRKAKTAAGTGREVDLPGGLLDELAPHKAASARTAPDDPVFLARPRNGEARRQTAANIGKRLKTAIKKANCKLAEADIEPISDRVTPHSLRRTYASLRAALPGEGPVYIAERLGHKDPAFTFRVYQRAVKRRERLADSHREAFDAALQWAAIGRVEAEQGRIAPELDAAASRPAVAGVPNLAYQRRMLRPVPG